MFYRSLILKLNILFCQGAGSWWIWRDRDVCNTGNPTFLHRYLFVLLFKPIVK